MIGPIHFYSFPLLIIENIIYFKGTISCSITYKRIGCPFGGYPFYFLPYGTENLKEAVCSCFSSFVSSFFVIPRELVCQIYQKYIPLDEHYTDKNDNKLVQMSCTAYIVYTFHLSLHHDNFGQFKAKQAFGIKSFRDIRVQCLKSPMFKKVIS